VTTFSLIGDVVSAIVWILSTIGLPGLFALMAVESFGIPPVPSEVILPFTGFLIAEGSFSWGAAMPVALVGALVGAYAAYALGRWGRHRITGIGLGSLRLEPEHLARMDRFFARRGESTVALARLVPVVRSYISYPAGTAEMEPVKFGVYTLIGSAPFTLGFVYAGFVLGSNWSKVSNTLAAFNYGAIAVIAIAVVYVALLVAGVLETGWPPRLRHLKARPEAAPAPPSSPPTR
jgi:membrane protein DedA with SNARE-associated domain